MKSTADALRDLGYPVPEHVLVLNVVRGLPNSYEALRTLVTHQRPTPTFLEVRDALTLEQLTQGLHTPASTTSTTSRALVAAPPPSYASLLGALPPGPSEGGGALRTAVGSWDAHPFSDLCSRSFSRRCALADLLQPVVRAYFHVAPLGSGRGPCPPHQLAAMVTGAASYALSWTPPPPQPSSTWPGGWVGGWWDEAAVPQSFGTVELTPPVGTEWIADSGASYHTTPDVGILSSARPPHPSCPSSIMVGDVSSCHFCGFCSWSLPPL
jgi:hypothetical protein